MDRETKERLLAEFQACLDDWDPVADSDAPNDDDAPAVNLALLFAELAVLRNEVRVEARQFKAALDKLHALTNMLTEQNRRLTRDLERAREGAATAQRQSERQWLLEMLDVRDRIGSAMEAFSAYRPGWLARLDPAQARLTQSLGEGIALTLGRLDEALGERRVRPIAAVGARLEPNTMRVIGTGHDQTRQSGEVLRVARRGYLRDDELLRLAEVIVNKLES